MLVFFREALRASVSKRQGVAPTGATSPPPHTGEGGEVANTSESYSTIASDTKL